MSEPNEVRDLTPEEVAAGLSAGNVMLVDVREPNETQIECIPGSVLLPLSQFDPHALPDPEGRTARVFLWVRHSFVACRGSRIGGGSALWRSFGGRSEGLESGWFPDRTMI